MISVFYRPEQTADVDVFSPSPRKPKLVVDAWLKNFPNQVEIKSFAPATVKQLCAVHSSDYVKGVLSGIEPNGFGTYHTEVANSLPYTSGSMLAAAKHALQEGVAVSPTSGFHHSGVGGYKNGIYGGAGAQGFCTFNALLVVSVDLINTGKVSKVGLCDMDYHFGNGSSSIILALGLKDKIKHFTAGKNYHNASQAIQFLDKLPKIIRAMSDCDIILAQCGADPWVNDPLGGFLTKDQLRERDKILFKTCKEIGVPVIWCLAGGYSKNLQDVLDIHSNTMAECIKVYEPSHG